MRNVRKHWLTFILLHQKFVVCASVFPIFWYPRGRKVNLLKHTIWAIAIMVSVVVIALETRKYSVEDLQQRSFMLKACVDAGGQWERDSWTPSYRCIRPAAPRT